MFQCVESREEKVKNLCSLFYSIMSLQAKCPRMSSSISRNLVFLASTASWTVCIQTTYTEHYPDLFVSEHTGSIFAHVLASLIHSPIVISLLFSYDDGHRWWVNKGIVNKSSVNWHWLDFSYKSIEWLWMVFSLNVSFDI